MAFVNFFFEWLVFFHVGVVATCCQLPLSVLFGISTRTFFYLFSSHYRSSKHVASLIPSLRHKLAIFWKQQIYIYIVVTARKKKNMCIPSPQLVVEGEKTKLDKCLARHFRPIPIICRRKPHVQGIMAGQTRFDFDYVFMIYMWWSWEKYTAWKRSTVALTWQLLNEIRDIKH